MHKKYINKYGNFSHNLNIEIDESLSEDEKNIILYDIFNLINEKHIKKYILNNIDVSIKWRVYDKTDLLHYYTLIVMAFLLIEQLTSIQNYY
jgi:hypothetical protein